MRIGILTSSRADFGCYKSLLERLKLEKKVHKKVDVLVKTVQGGRGEDGGKVPASIDVDDDVPDLEADDVKTKDDPSTRSPTEAITCASPQARSCSWVRWLPLPAHGQTSGLFPNPPAL